MLDAITTEAIVALALAGTAGWVFTTWLRVKNGYPLEGSWGQQIKPVTDNEAKQRISLLTQENAELRAEIGSMKDRLANVERIVTDRGYHLGAEIESLREPSLATSRDKGTA
jgi:hypothetical protein